MKVIKNIKQLKEFYFKKNIYDVYYIINKQLVLVVADIKPIFPEMDLSFIFLKQSELDEFISNLNMQDLFDYAINGYNVVGHSLTKNFFKALKKQNGPVRYNKNNETIVIDVKDLNITTRKGAGILLYNPNKKKFLILKYNLPGEDYWGLVKGGIEEGETVKDAIYRETIEETGLKLEKVFYENVFYTMHNYLATAYKVGIINKNEVRKSYIYWHVAFTSESDVKLSDEHIDYKWVDLKDAKNMLTYERDYNLLVLMDKYIKEDLK